MPQKYEEIPLFMTVEQFAQITGRNPDNVRRNIRKGIIPADRVNKKYLICRDTVFANAAAYYRAVGAEGVACVG